MKKDNFPGAVAHGDAWRYFMKTLEENPGLFVGGQEYGWLIFLHGWLAKAKQQQQGLRERK